MSDSTPTIAAAKLPLTSEDIGAQRLDALRELFPEAFAEGALDTQKLSALIGQSAEQSRKNIGAAARERYGLSWNGKAAAHQAVQSLSTGTLRPAPDESVNFDTSENLIIEGDNLEVLKLLQKSYSRKVKMIYIDPPYNTGNEFIYPDNFREGLQTYLEYSGQVKDGVRQTTNAESSGRYHSNWLNMMYPRLFLARNLLREDGVIFVSIDEHEIANLTLLMNEIFGEENLVGTLIWQKRKGGGNDSFFLAIDHEYVVVYARNLESQKEKWRVTYEEEYLKRYREEDEESRFYWDTLARPNLRNPIVYDVECPDGSVIKNGQWQMSKAEFLRKKESGDIRIVEDKKGGWTVHHKVRQPEGRVFRSLLKAETNTDAAKQMEILFDTKKVFSNPKPVGLTKSMAELSTENNDIILDFFAGSGTTAQAVLELNEADSGNRKFILVQLPEPTASAEYSTIAEITKERVRRVITKLNDADGSTLPMADAPAPDRGFKVFKLDSSNFKVWDADNAPKDAAALAAQLLLYAEHRLPERSAQDVFYELLLKSGRALTAPVEEKTLNGQTVYSVAADEKNGALLVCLEDPIAEETLREMIALAPSQVLCLDCAFEGNDQLKNNIVLQMKDAEISFRTV